MTDMVPVFWSRQKRTKDKQKKQVIPIKYEKKIRVMKICSKRTSSILGGLRGTLRERNI